MRKPEKNINDDEFDARPWGWLLVALLAVSGLILLATHRFRQFEASDEASIQISDIELPTRAVIVNPETKAVELVEMED